MRIIHQPISKKSPTRVQQLALQMLDEIIEWQGPAAAVEIATMLAFRANAALAAEKKGKAR